MPPDTEPAGLDWFWIHQRALDALAYRIGSPRDCRTCSRFDTRTCTEGWWSGRPGAYDLAANLALARLADGDVRLALLDGGWEARPHTCGGYAVAVGALRAVAVAATTTRDDASGGRGVP